MIKRSGVLRRTAKLRLEPSATQGVALATRARQLALSAGTCAATVFRVLVTPDQGRVVGT